MGQSSCDLLPILLGAALNEVGEKILPILQASFSTSIGGCCRPEHRRAGFPSQALCCARILVVTFCVLVGFLHGAMALELGSSPQPLAPSSPEQPLALKPCFVLARHELPQHYKVVSRLRCLQSSRSSLVTLVYILHLRLWAR